MKNNFECTIYVQFNEERKMVLRLKRALLSIVAMLVIVSISFAAQSALAIEEFDVQMSGKEFKGLGLYIDENEYSLSRILFADPDEEIGGVNAGFIQENIHLIKEGLIDGMRIENSDTIARSGGSESVS